MPTLNHRLWTILRLLLLTVLPCFLVGCPLPGASEDILLKEQAAFDDVNTERVAEGLEPLIMREDLRLVARVHSEDMVARDFFNHDNPDGESPFDRAAEAGIVYRRYGENIAWNNFSNPVNTAVTGWMNSPGHRANIMDASFTHTGMGVAHDGAGGYYFTQVFLTPTSR
jgi:uncharacterized protein YkwD